MLGLLLGDSASRRGLSGLSLIVEDFRALGRITTTFYIP